jgi:ribonucleoside-diphosphate reductase alpha chain
VINSHYSYSKNINVRLNESSHGNPYLSKIIKKEANDNWDYIVKNIETGLESLRNSQVTLVAPTGTISFLMGCDTFGIQPEFSFVKYKNLTEGHQTAIPMINKIFIEGLRNLGYQENKITSIKNAILSEKKPIEESGIKNEHLAIFDTEMKSGNRSLDPAALIQMMASVQPFLSGAISSTINIPNDTTKEKIYELFFMAWKMGLKGITIYRDGSKASQVLVTKKWETVKDARPVGTLDKEEIAYAIGAAGGKEGRINIIKALSPKIEMIKIKRNKLPKTRRAINHKFQIGGCKGYIDAGEYPNGELGEIFLTVSKQGSTLNGLLDSLAIMTSVCLQYGVPLYALVKKMIGTRFEPSGMTDNPDIRFTSSIIDYIYRFLGLTYLKEDEKIKLGLIKHTTNDHKEEMVSSKKIDQSNPLCINCGQIMNKIGSCYSCLNCGESLGSCG